MAFGANELRVLRRALAAALHPVPLPAEDARACLRLADAVDEAVSEAARQRTFLAADLARYRRALPGAASTYLELLQEALAAGYEPTAEDLAALRPLSGDPEAAAVLRRCLSLAEQGVRDRLAQGAPPGAASGAAPRAAAPEPAAPEPSAPEPSAPAPSGRRRGRLLALPGGRAADEPRKPSPQSPRPRPTPGERPTPPVPKPSEVFPPRRKPTPPPSGTRAAG
ncbi:hypothetical protein NPS70_24710 [Streptomyces sp. C10-9-1]|uniref:hypothetical protein n=1 Tax=Streptomyces sp. C10-9-1 TaxID=1859285 RepID=UPI002112C1DE|nr:hypothetical protein [Streptomyces sp. C10-9-1]MCQ6556358.1 hypothetical protein [Streptomyces sp. C10-9-1]